MKELQNKIYNSEQFKKINGDGADHFYTGLSGSSESFLLSKIFHSNSGKLIYCSDNSEKLFYIRDDLSSLIEDENDIVIYLSEYDEEYETELSPISNVLKKLSGSQKFIILTDPSAFSRKIISEEVFKKNIITLEKDSEQNFEELIIKLASFNFRRKKLIEEANDFAVRGGIIDIFPENMSQPIRIEFFGDTIESIRDFDAATQRSINQLKNIEILPPTSEYDKMSTDSYYKLHDYIKDDTLLIFDQPDIIAEKNEKLLNNDKLMRSYISTFSLSKSILSDKYLKEINFITKSQPAFNTNVKLLIEDLKRLKQEGFSIYLTASDEYQSRRFQELIDDLDENNELKNIHYFDSCIHSGFILLTDKIAVYTEHEVFGRYYRTTKKKRKFSGITFKDLSKINYGDYMVHQNYGIGKYAGLHKIYVGGIEQEAVKLLYQDLDVLFVNLNSLHLIKKYSAQEGHTPKVSKLGGTEWDKLKQKTKKKIQDIAKDLILLYSKRKSQKGFRFSGDTVWQKELEASFIYEDTPDQISATEAVKNDMENINPMDRLICGDVGFGKTEVAIRASFKCILDNKQAAILVPTTILAEQHYNTFRDRLSKWAVEVEHLSRFKTKKEQKDVLAKLKEGKINIVIGTHRLLSKDVEFKDLGLLIVDEEQRFGVTHKEKIKMMRANVDVLTLTATPIPRTLNFSMLGARDLSIINTPPKNRQPIHTEIINFDKKIISNGLIRELQRGGQVYFVNDKIAQLEQIAYMIEDMLPFAKVAIAHGQMKPSELERVMMGFLEKKYNVLVCTKIIESGLDIPTVNTIFINRADNFGLAELYQLRGRVGRSNIKSYAYLIAPPQSSLTKDAIRRLHALEEFTELGSGLNLALRDMEIRGAGNLLGSEQSGFINDIGFDMYMQILDEAVQELKLEAAETEGFKIPDIEKLRETKLKRDEILIETDVSTYLPEFYIEDENVRLEIYQKLTQVYYTSEINGIRDELNDRFGKIPEQAEALLILIEIKILALELQFEKIYLKGSMADLYYSIKNEELFKSGKFEKIIKYLNDSEEQNMKMKQTKDSLIIIYKVSKNKEGIEKLVDLKAILTNMLKTVQN